MIFIGVILLVFIGLPIGVGLLLYFVPKKLGYPKTGKYLARIFGVVVGVLALMTIFEDEIFTKNDARKLVAEQEIVLADDFELESNKSMWAPGDYYHTFTLLISEQDKLNAIEKIKKSSNFKKNKQPTDGLLFDLPDRYNGPRQTQNYETETTFIREYIQPNGQGYAPTFRRLKVDKKEKELTFEDIDP